jgi:hypothetical protein
LIDRPAQFNDGMEAFPGHTVCPAQQGVDVHQFGAIPMLLQDAPAAFNRIVFAVIGRVVQQLDGFADVIGEVYQAFEELSSHPTAFRTIIYLQLKVRDSDPLGYRGIVPPVIQTVDNEIAGLAGTAKGQMELSAVLIHQPEGDIFFFTAPIVVSGPIVTPGFPTARVVADLHRGFAIDTQALDLSVCGSLRLRESFAILFGEVDKDGIGFRELFLGLALITLRRR